VSPGRIKVCGLTRTEDVAAAVALGADLLGLNFWPRSPRWIDRETGRALAEAARRAAQRRGREILLAGVFVNQSREAIEALDRAVGLDLIQLHGDEPPEFAATFGKRLLRAVRSAGAPAPEVFGAYPTAWGFLVDVEDGVRYGGTGEAWDYGALAALLAPAPGVPKEAGTSGKEAGTLVSRSTTRDCKEAGTSEKEAGTFGRGEAGRLATGQPVLIAGGIRPGNARAALGASGAWGVDVCSGVEATPGIKDLDLMRELFTEVHHGEGATAP